jgi:hypothetical protein
LVAFVLESVAVSILRSLILLFLAFLFFRLTAKKFLSALSIGILTFIGQSLFFTLTIHPLLAVAAFISSVCVVIALWRFGLLGLVGMQFFFVIIFFVPYTFDTSSFYFSTSVAGMLLIVGLAVYAFYTSIAGHSLYGGDLLGKIGNE